MAKITKLILICICTIMLNSCYHADIQQGNNLTAEQVKELKLGMTKAAVINLLGSPVLEDVFNDQRLVYVYTLLPNSGDYVQKKMTLYFKHDRLIKIEGSSSFTQTTSTTN